jgi:hypothetical protein
MVLEQPITVLKEALCIAASLDALQASLMAAASGLTSDSWILSSI